MMDLWPFSWNLLPALQTPNWYPALNQCKIDQIKMFHYITTVIWLIQHLFFSSSEINLPIITKYCLNCFEYWSTNLKSVVIPSFVFRPSCLNKKSNSREKRKHDQKARRSLAERKERHALNRTPAPAAEPRGTCRQNENRRTPHGTLCRFKSQYFLT